MHADTLIGILKVKGYHVVTLPGQGLQCLKALIPASVLPDMQVNKPKIYYQP